MKRWLKTILLVVAIFLLPTLWLLASHIVAKRAAERYKARLRVAGEKLTIDELLPPRIPPDRNGAELFSQALLYLHPEGAITRRPPAMKMVAPGKAMIGWQQPYILDELRRPIASNTWNDIEGDLEKYGPGLEQLRQAAARPEIDFGVDYRDIFKRIPPNLARMNWVALLLRSASVFDLNHGETPSAVTNLHTSLSFVNQRRNERTMISQESRYSMTIVACEAQWEVLQATNLNDSELSMLQHDWESMEFIQPLEHALEMERAREILALQDLRTSNSPSAYAISVVAGLGAGSSSTSSYSLKNFSQAAARKTSDILWRTSWSYRDELRALQARGILIEAVRQVETNGFFKDALAEKDRKIKMLGPVAASTNWLRYSLNDRFVSWFGNFAAGDTTVERMMSLEGTRRLVIAAIALKRFQLLRGVWPSDLKTLVPDFLSEVPRDPLDGLPLRYHTNADGTFTLYSIGYDAVDNGGDPSPLWSNPHWLHARDWVWPQPATAEETQQYYKNLEQGHK
jgi:hypothetical protein